MKPGSTLTIVILVNFLISILCVVLCEGCGDLLCSAAVNGAGHLRISLTRQPPVQFGPLSVPV
jgi:hypothetical protein